MAIPKSSDLQGFDYGGWDYGLFGCTVAPTNTSLDDFGYGGADYGLFHSNDSQGVVPPVTFNSNFFMFF